MLIKMAKRNKEDRLYRLHKNVLSTMEIDNGFLILKGIDCRVSYRLEKVYPQRESKFNYEFVKKLIEQADIK